MDLDIQTKHPFELKNNYHVPQTSFWGHFKQSLGWSAAGFHIHLRSNKKLVHTTDMLVLQKRISTDATLAYIPYVPIEKPHDWHTGLLLENLAEAIKPYLPIDCIFIRYDIAWKSPWINDGNRHDSHGNWLGNPAVHTRELRMNFGTKHHALRKAVTDILPSNTFIVDLTLPNGELLTNMKSKTRYNIRLSQRKGVNVRIADDKELVKWYLLYKETTIRNNIYSSDFHFFSTVFNSIKIDRETELYLLLAEYEQQPIAGMFLATTNGRATYLYGASAAQYHKLMGTYQLQYQAMQLAKKRGCNSYDMFGVAPSAHVNHPMHGLYRFKSGFGGQFVPRQGCWDYMFDDKKYYLFRAAEGQTIGYHN